jgi:DNA end-binding protein Ku
VSGEEIVAPKEEAAPKVIDLMEALRRSLDQVSAGRKPTAKAEAEPEAKKAVAKGGARILAAKPAARKRKAS